jgi:hypothetical protein
MKSVFKQIGVIALVAVIGFSFAALSLTGCGGGDGGGGGGGGDPDLSGTITINPTTATVNTELTATYSGAEAVSYQWKKNNNAILNATTRYYTPMEAGSYTVTVSAAGYKSKTSNAVNVSGGNLNYNMTGTYTFAKNSQSCTWVFNADGSYEVTGYGISGTKTGTWSSTGNDITISYNSSGGSVSVTGEEVFTVQESDEQVILSLKDNASLSNVLVSLGLSANSVTLTRTSVLPPPTQVTVQGADLAAKLAWIKANAQTNATYIVTVDKNESLAGFAAVHVSNNALWYGEKDHITVQLQGTGGEKTVTLSSDGWLFYVASGVTLILDNNITLKGKSDNTTALVLVPGTLVMKTGAKISDNNKKSSNNGSYYGGGVCILREGTFIMNGGEISGNSSSSGGGVYVAENGTFTMEGGKISNNSARQDGGGVSIYGTFTMNGGEISVNNASGSSSCGGGVSVNNEGTFTMNGGKISNNSTTAGSSSCGGGGVYVANYGTFTMNNGEISGNTASFLSGYVWWGGGVSISSEGIFTKSGGTITGYANDTSNGNVVKMSDGTVLNDRGHAVAMFDSFGSSNTKRRETTAGPTVNMDSSKSGAEGGWEN